jgi:hypothetical protein
MRKRNNKMAGKMPRVRRVEHIVEHVKSNLRTAGEKNGISAAFITAARFLLRSLMSPPKRAYPLGIVELDRFSAAERWRVVNSYRRRTGYRQVYASAAALRNPFQTLEDTLCQREESAGSLK